MNKYWSETVRQLKPYVPGEQPQNDQFIKLNTNENPYPPSPAVNVAVTEYDVANFRLYPDPESRDLRLALADYEGLSLEQIFVGNGSDEVLAHAFKAFFEGTKSILFPDIGYSFYPVYCALFSIGYQPIPLDAKFEIDISEYRRENGGIIIANPNAPTGISLPVTEIRELLQSSDAVVIIDEAYVDFGAESAKSLIADYPNLLIVKTFSKSRSLAGIRLGYALGDVDLIEALNRVKNSFNSYPIDRMTAVAAIASLGDDDYFQECNQKIIKSRSWLCSALIELGFEVLPSSSNFIFINHPSRSAADLYTALKKARILVRHFDNERIKNFLRITIGTDEECKALVANLKILL